MEKKWLTAILFSCVLSQASAQTLFTYGPYKADAKEFLKAFNKNDAQTSKDRNRAMKEYLDLFVNSRLKIREAYDRGYDSLPHIKSEIENLRSQVIENYMSDPETLNRLTKEALQRSQKDIHAAHIFISFKNANGVVDSMAARKKMDDVLNRLARKEDFLKVAQELSDDPAAKQNNGDLNYITLFTLPYEFETLVYKTPVGKQSTVFTSRSGYHIFKNLGERKALGKIKVQQILVAFPPGADHATRDAAAKLADSIYKRIQAGDDFGKLAATYSNDYISGAAEGNIPDVVVGQYDPAFERFVWSLKDGTVSKPFLTSHGYHIVKRITARPVTSKIDDPAVIEDMQQKVRANDRWKTGRDFIYNTVRTKAGFEKYPYKDHILWAYADSLIENRPFNNPGTITGETPIFKVGDTTIRVKDWVTYGFGYRYQQDGTIKTYPVLLEEFTKSVLYNYYRSHLEEFNEDFRNQMTEFRDGNLFFEIMQQEIWNKAQSDTAALLALYEKNKQQYNWKPSADALIFFCSDEASAKQLEAELKKQPGRRQEILHSMADKIVVDSARYEWSQIPGLGSGTPKDGMLTNITLNKSDQTASFAYISKVYTSTSPRSFNDAKGLVMNDYQNLLEEEWISRLRKKYPVVIDQKVLAGVLK
jgi:peptidyl-prolyl cis-trans isomerase SurA